VGSAVGLEPRFTFISHGIGWKRRAILRRLEETKIKKKGGKVRHSSQCRAPGLWGVCGVYQQACPVDRLRLDYDWTSRLWRRAYTASSPLRLCARSLSQPSLRPPRRASPRKVECESEQADALCLHKCAATASASLSMRGARLVGVCVGFDAGLYRWRWL